MAQKEPLVSVLMTSYNGMPYIKDVIDSIVAQTHKNLELIIVDDHSTDGTLSFLKSISNPNIFVHLNPSKGRGKALNFGLSKCQGKYIAINDADDKSLPVRLEKQVHFLEHNPDHVLVGTHSYLFDYDTQTKKSHKRPLSDADIRMAFTKGQPIQHVTVLMRNEAVNKIGGYNEKIKFLFDRDIFVRIGVLGKYANLQEELVEVGHHPNRFFYFQFKGVEREWLSLKYKYMAIRLNKFPKHLYIKATFASLFNILPSSFKKRTTFILKSFLFKNKKVSS
jgi:glycosyltransferase involved in cell wall biosynthesis